MMLCGLWSLLHRIEDNYQQCRSKVSGHSLRMMQTCSLIFHNIAEGKWWERGINPPVGRGTLKLFGWGCAAGTLEPLAYTRASSSELCYLILD